MIIFKKNNLAFFILLFAGLITPTFGQNISTLRVKNLDGSRFEINQSLGKGPVLLTFWATWCKPCRKELPALKPIYDDFQDQGLVILAVSQDSPRSLSKVRAYVRNSGLPYKFVLDPNGEESSRLLVRDVPYTILADSQGDIVYTHRGYREGDEIHLRSKIEQLFDSEDKKDKTE